jgi:hypothetical protein
MLGALGTFHLKKFLENLKRQHVPMKKMTNITLK